MADDQTLDPRGASRIDITAEPEVRYWTERLACSELELRCSVAAVGERAVDVRDQLGRA